MSWEKVEKPCYEDETLVCGENCGGCRCAACENGSKWAWNGRRPE